MTLADFLAISGEPDVDFAKRIGVSRQSLHRYRSGERRPEWDVLERIVSATGGAVTANDFLTASVAVSTSSATPAQPERLA